VVTYLLLIALSIAVTGCSVFGKKTTLFVIDKTDIQAYPKGAKVVIPAGSQWVDEDGNTTITWEEETELTMPTNGYLLSNWYLQDVVEANIERK